MEREKTQEREAAAALAKALGNLPLALEQAAAYATQARLSLAEYLELFRAREPEVAARLTGAEEYPTALATVFDITFARVRTESPAAADLLTLCAFLAPDEVPLEILKDSAEHLPPALAEASADPEKLAASAAVLQNYALAKVRGGSFLTLHHFIQAAARDRLGEDDRKNWAGATVQLMEAAFPFDYTNPQTWPPSARLLPHALAAAEHARELKVLEKATSSLLNQAGLYLQTKAELVKAKVTFEQALETVTPKFGAEHSLVSTLLNNLGNVLYDMGDFDGARASYERALAIAETVYGLDHLEVAIRLNNLGVILQDMGDFDGARVNFERALVIAESHYGSDHQQVAIYLNNLGELLKRQGDLEGARERLERALAIDEAAPVLNPTSIATRLNNLGSVLRRIGDLNSALTNFERALAMDEVTYGPNHPTVALRLNNVGTILDAQGDLSGARANYERALGIFREVLGEDHPLTLLVKRNLAGLGGKGEGEGES
ncbi:MAG TPA: tetratricopeptide repeat protein [Pyrinomonadaceae bacterium]|nr:tetratricopeptide repeat protein [Pyrinomonadaceae bacterium]